MGINGVLWFLINFLTANECSTRDFFFLFVSFWITGGNLPTTLPQCNENKLEYGQPPNYQVYNLKHGQTDTVKDTAFAGVKHGCTDEILLMGRIIP